jgi:hypothetical protein
VSTILVVSANPHQVTSVRTPSPFRRHHLNGPTAYAADRVEPWGIYIDMVIGTIRLSDRGVQKMLWSKVTDTSSAVLLHDLQSLVSLLRWYSVVIPLAHGALQGLLAL